MAPKPSADVPHRIKWNRLMVSPFALSRPTPYLMGTNLNSHLVHCAISQDSSSLVSDPFIHVSSTHKPCPVSTQYVPLAFRWPKG